MYCRKCGKELPTDDRFCPKCGNEVVDLKDMSVEKTYETPFEPKAPNNKSKILGFGFSVLSIVISIVGTAMLCWALTYLLRWIFSSLQAPPQSIYGVQFLEYINQSITSHDWMFVLVPIALVLLIINICIFVRKHKKGALSIASLCLSILFLIIGVVSWGSALHVIFTADELLTPSECLLHLYDEDDVQSIMEDLEQYGFVEQNFGDEYLTILDANGNAQVRLSISMSESIDEAYRFFLNNSVLGSTDANEWYAVVDDGTVTDIFMKTNTDIYMYVENGVLTANPCSNYLFSKFIPVETNITHITDLVEEKIIKKYNVSEEDVDFLWEGAIRDRENSTFDVWQACIHGSFIINEQKYTAYIILASKPDEEIYTLMANNQTDSWSFYVKYYINE